MRLHLMISERVVEIITKSWLLLNLIFYLSVLLHSLKILSLEFSRFLVREPAQIVVRKVHILHFLLVPCSKLANLVIYD